jgi:hypothetical protein
MEYPERAKRETEGGGEASVGSVACFGAIALLHEVKASPDAGHSSETVGLPLSIPTFCSYYVSTPPMAERRTYRRRLPGRHPQSSLVLAFQVEADSATILRSRSLALALDGHALRDMGDWHARQVLSL